MKCHICGTDNNISDCKHYYKSADNEKVDSKTLSVSISHHEHTGNFFICFEENGKCLSAVKVTEPQALNYSNEFGIKILK